VPPSASESKNTEVNRRQAKITLPEARGLDLDKGQFLLAKIAGVLLEFRDR